MSIFTRYILRELLKVLTLSGISLTCLMLLIGIVTELLSQGLGISHVAQIILYVLPNALVFALPGALLLSVTIVYARMSAANEIQAAKSFGIHPAMLFLPALVLGFLLSLANVWLYDLSVSWGFRGVQRVVLASTDDVAYGILRSQKTFQVGRFSIVVQEVLGRTLVNPVVTVAGDDDEPGVTIRAQRAQLRADMKAEVLHLLFENGTMELESQARLHFDRFERDIPLAEVHKKHEAMTLPAHLPMHSIPDELVLAQQQLDSLRDRMAVQTTFALITGNFNKILQKGKTLDWETQVARERIARLRTEPPRRWATGLSCLCFALVGSTMAVWRRNAEIINIFFSCYAPILAVYYPLMISSLEVSKSGQFPPLVVWMGDVVLLAWGCFLWRRIIRY